MARGVQAEALAVEALGRLVGEPSAKVLHGSKAAAGVFAGGSAAEKAAAKLCLENRWLEATGQFAGKGKTRKELYRLAPAGLQAVLKQKDPSDLLRSLNGGLERLQHTLAEALRPLEALPGLVHSLKASVGHVLEQVRPIDTEALLRKLAAAPAPAPAPPSADGSKSHKPPADWGDEVVRLVTEQKQRNAFQRLTLPQIYERLRARHPGLTLGQFHDGLRTLQDEKRIRLGPYTQALATLDDPRNALFLDREVKFYVDLP